LSPERIRLEPGHPEIRSVRIVETENRNTVEVVAERVRERALAEGVVQGMAIAQEREAKALAEAAERLDTRREEIAGELAHSALELGVAIARQLVRAEVNRGGHDIESIVREALAAASTGRSQCVIHVHPDDFEALRDARFRSGTSVQADIGVARGDVHVEASMGLMVREIDEAIDSISARLREELQ